MAKKIVQDVVPPQRSIRNIPLSNKATKDETKLRTPRRRVSSASAERAEREESDMPSPRGRSRVREEKTRWSEGRKPRTVLWAVLAIAMFAIAYSLTFIFASATVRITPKQWSVPIQRDLEASKNSSVLAYNLVTVTEEMSKTVPASGEESVEEKASGLITVFNTQKQSQQLVKNTRFETPKGLIFRINAAVTIPSATTKNGATIPGSATVRVYADKAGPAYNVGLSDFTIPGFVGDPRFKSVTAKSDPSSPISGGFVGKRGKVKETDLQVAYTDLEKNLRAKLAAQVAPQVPQSHVFFPSAYVISFEKMPVTTTGQASATGTTAIVKEKAVLTGVLFDKAQLTTVLTPSFPAEISKIPSRVKEWSNVQFAFKNNSEGKLASGEAIQFSLTGSPSVEAVIKPLEIASALAGKKRGTFSQVMSGIPSVGSAELSTRPAWAWSLPKNSDKIKVLMGGQ